MAQCQANTHEGHQCTLTAKDGSPFCGRHQEKDSADGKIITPQQFRGSFSNADVARTTQWLDTGNYALNWAISGRFLHGWPFGRVAEIYGDPSTGKSFLILNAIAQVMKKGGFALLDDTEGAYFPDWGEGKFGISNSKLGYAVSHTVADHQRLVKRFIELQGKLAEPLPAVIGLDSIALLSTTQELNRAYEARDMTKAQEVRILFRTIGKPLQELPTVYLATNHVIANIGDFVNPRSTPGGGGIKFQASVRLDLYQPTKVRDPNTKDPIGTIVNAYVDKSRVSYPWRRVRIAIPFFQPLSPSSGLVPVLLQLGILAQATEKSRTAGRIFYEDASVPLHKSNHLAQDVHAAEFLRRYPDLLEKCDEYMAQLESEYSFSSAEEMPSEEGVV